MSVVAVVELWPRGQPQGKRHLGTVTISNVGGTTQVGEYAVTLSKIKNPRQIWRRARIDGFKRKVGGGLDLLMVGLVAAMPDRISKVLVDSSSEIPPSEVMTTEETLERLRHLIEDLRNGEDKRAASVIAEEIVGIVDTELPIQMTLDGLGI